MSCSATSSISLLKPSFCTVRTINFRFISRVVGLMCLVESIVALMCLVMSFYFGESPLPFGLGALAYLASGLGLSAIGRELKEKQAGRREGMLTVTSTWLILSIIATIPMMLSGATPRFVDALVECMSGFTTTGATVFAEVEHLPNSILFFRSLMQWQGGIGIVVFTIALVPIFGGGASQIFNAETTGITHERFLPRITDVAKRLCLVYIAETALLILLLWLGPMGLFDSVCHALSCLSTGGYSTRNAGIAAYNSPYIEYVLLTFMYLGALNLTLVFFAVTGHPLKLWRDEEFKWFNVFIGGMTLISTVWVYTQGLYDTVEESFRRAAFQIISLGSSTGFLTADITEWKPFFWMLALLVMFVNGCAGSTSGGLKVARLVVLIKNLYNEFKKQIHPHLFTPVTINGRQISISVVHQVLAFCVVYLMLIFVGSLLIMLDGNGFLSSLSIACSAVSNSGPGIGEYLSSISTAGDFTKYLLAILMLVGRLEIFTVIGILAPHFWRK